MIGLSAQDNNIQEIFASAQAQMAWDWSATPLAHVFAEDALGQDQRNILRFVYGDQYDADPPAVEASALLRAYAKPALTGLVLHTLCAKLQALVAVADAPHLTDAERRPVQEGLKQLRDRVAAAAPADCLNYVRALVAFQSQGMAMFQEGAPVSAGSFTYRPIGQVPIQRTSGDPNLATSGLRELACALGLMGIGEQSGEWAVLSSDPAQPSSGSVRLRSPSEETRVFFAANTHAAVHLEVNGLVNESDPDAVVVHSTAPVPRLPRSPVAAPGRTGHVEPRHVGMRDLLRGASSAGELFIQFREEAAV
jgi:hypothetical protein